MTHTHAQIILFADLKAGAGRGGNREGQDGKRTPIEEVVWEVVCPLGTTLTSGK